MSGHKNIIISFVTLLSAFVLGGCTTSTYSFKVDAINNPDPKVKELKSYKIVSANAERDEQDLEFQEVAEYIKTVLSGRGYYEAPHRESVEMIIDISYEIGEPQTTSYKRITEPIFGSIAFVEEKYYPVITYEKHLRIVSRENREKKDNETPIHIWSVHIKNSDESDNLGKYVLLMAAAAIPYIGENTESEREIKIKEQDDIVVFVKEGLKDD